MTFEEYQNFVRARLTPSRFEHSCRVAEQAAALARKYGGDEAKALTAGILHDIMKDTPKAVQLQTIEKYSIILDNVEKAAPKLLHAISGAAVVRFELKIEDPDIIAAIRYHTTARAGMSLLEKIIYLADYISADRDYEGVEGLRQAINGSLSGGM